MTAETRKGSSRSEVVESVLPLAALLRRYDRDRREDPRHFVRPLAYQLHDIADRDHLEELLHVPIPHPDASVRRVLADRRRHTRPVNPVALLA